jgi:glutathione S-transferase
VRVLWLLEELGVPYEVENVEFTLENLKGPSYTKIHPFGRVPALQDGELTMFESGAIVEYLLERYGNGRLTPPVGSPRRGTFLQWLHFAEATALPPLSDIAQHSFFKPESERIPAVVADARNRATTILSVLERELAGKQYLLGDELSAADIMLGYSLLLNKFFGLLDDRYPNLVAYLGRLEARPAFKKALG